MPILISQIETATDQGIRNVFNYGHSFGHAIEIAINFSISHGIAVIIGHGYGQLCCNET